MGPTKLPTITSGQGNSKVPGLSPFPNASQGSNQELVDRFKSKQASFTTPNAVTSGQKSTRTAPVAVSKSKTSIANAARRRLSGLQGSYRKPSDFRYDRKRRRFGDQEQ